MDTAAVSRAIREVADAEILPRFRALADDEIIEKRPGDLVTVADRQAERALAAIFRADDPDCLVVGEEGIYADASPLARLATAERAWVIDPVDGTRNFAAGRGDFAVMVAEVRAGVTTRSWIWQPIHRRLYIAERGGGVTCNGRPIRPRAMGQGIQGAMWGRFARPARPSGISLRPLAGCCGVDYPQLAEGTLDFLGYRSMHPWDHLPGALMVTELGGRVATVEGRDYAAGVRGRFLIAARSGTVWRQATDVVGA